jgi:hypothetical protein
MGETNTKTSDQTPPAFSEHSPTPQQGPLTGSEKVIPNLEGLRHEYTEVNNNIRHYSNLRFTAFTVYFAILGGLISVAFGFFEVKGGNPEHMKLWSRIGGLLITSLFLQYHLRIQAVLVGTLEVGVKLESLLGYSQITSRSLSQSRLTNHLTTAFYCLLIIFWLTVIVRTLLTIVST